MSDRERPLDGRKGCARGNAFVLCPGGREQIVYAQNYTCEAGEPIHVVLGLKNGCESFEEEALVWPRVVAHIEWGLGGQTFTAKCDVQNGVQFAVVGETIRVEAEYCISTPPWAPEALANPPVYVVSGGLGYCGTRKPTFTELAQVETVGQSVRLPIPAYASTFTVLPVNDGRADIRIVGDGGGYGVNARIGIPPANQDQEQYNAEEGFSIPNGARWIEVKNANLQAGPLFAFLVFELTL